MKKNERLEITLCGRAVASFENEADLMRTAAARITEWDAEAQKHANRSVELALAIGATLLAVKGKLPHGAFMLWVSQNCGSVSHTTATRYMALAEAAARRFALGEAADDPAAGEEAQKAVADQAAETERHFERSLSRLYLDWGIVSRPKGEHSWGGDRREVAAENGNKVGRPAKNPDLSEDARKSWTLALESFRKMPDTSYRFVPLGVAEGVIAELNAVCDKLAARIAELKKAEE